MTTPTSTATSIPPSAVAAFQSLSSEDLRSPAFTEWLECTDRAIDVMSSFIRRADEAPGSDAYRPLLREIDEYTLTVERVSATFVGTFTAKLLPTHPLIQMVQSIRGAVASVQEMVRTEMRRLAATAE